MMIIPARAVTNWVLIASYLLKPLLTNIVKSPISWGTSWIRIDKTVANAMGDDDDDDDDEANAAPNANPSVRLCKLSASIFKIPTVVSFWKSDKNDDDDDDDDDDSLTFVDDDDDDDDDDSLTFIDDNAAFNFPDDDDVIRLGLRERPFLKDDGEGSNFLSLSLSL